MITQVYYNVHCDMQCVWITTISDRNYSVKSRMRYFSHRKPSKRMIRNLKRKYRKTMYEITY